MSKHLRIHLHKMTLAKVWCLQNRPYKLGELERVIAVPKSTLRDWMKHGLKYSRQQNQHIVLNGLDVKDWITEVRRDRQKFRPRGMKPDEAYCMKCRRPVTITGEIREVPHGKCMRRSGICPICSAHIHRVIPPQSKPQATGESPLSTTPVTVIQRPINPENAQLLQAYLIELKRDIDNDKTFKRYASYLQHVLEWASSCSFFHAPSVEPSLREYLKTARRDGRWRALAFETCRKVLLQARQFFNWLRDKHPIRSKDIKLSWVERFRPSRSTTFQNLTVPNSLDRPRSETRRAVTLEEILAIAAQKVDENDLVGWRDQAAACFLFASGMRAGAFCSMPILAFNPKALTVRQFPHLGVKTKNSTSATTSLLRIPELIDVINRWDTYLRSNLPETAMWFPPITNTWGEKSLNESPPGENRGQHLIKAMRRIYLRAGLEYRNPHAHRHGSSIFAISKARDLADFKAISQNLMHSDVFITDRTYNKLNPDDRHSRISGLLDNPTSKAFDSGLSNDTEFVDRLANIVADKVHAKWQSNAS